jgi:hypothetical protein
MVLYMTRVAVTFWAPLVVRFTTRPGAVTCRNGHVSEDRPGNPGQGHRNTFRDCRRIQAYGPMGGLCASVGRWRCQFLQVGQHPFGRIRGAAPVKHEVVQDLGLARILPSEVQTSSSDCGERPSFHHAFDAHTR